MEPNIIFTLVILIFSAVIHEICHGYAALFLGDPTAKLEGRLTLNPLKHLDPLGSVIVPIITSFAGMTFGWAKPVPYNPYNLRNQRWGEAIVAFAGPFSNIIIAILFGLLIRGAGQLGIMYSPFKVFAGVVVLVNIVLALFNLIPVPPLDGSKILFSIFPRDMQNVRTAIERYSIFILLFVIFFLWKFVSPLIFTIFTFLTGIGS